ncbi:MAG: hypothetical protein PHE55_19310 [Methylococcaceae bacterium]|nr:hypothetical protein [Methylococcaceae bacterium]
MKKITKIGLVSLVAVAAAAMAPQAAFAHAKKHVKKGHHHHVHHHVNSRTHKITHHTVTHTGRYEHAPAYATAAEVAALRAELAKARAENKSEVRAVSERTAAADAAVEAKLAQHEEDTVSKNTLFFRGGYTQMEHPRHNELLTTHDFLTPGYNRNEGEGWYVGAGLDHRLSNNFWGLTDLVAVDGEVMFEYKNYGSSSNGLVSSYGAAGVIPNGGVGGNMKNQITQFTLTASPKLKFNTGTPITPWIIPFGLGIHVISPPSSGVTVLNPGLMVGAGAEVALMKSLVAGMDFRYHFTGDDLRIRSANNLLNRVNTDGLTTGAYLGFKF